MENKSIDLDFSQNITITSLLLTSIYSLANLYLFNEKFIKNCYGLSIVTLIFCYVMLSIINLHSELYPAINKILRLNLFVSGLSIVFAMNLLDLSNDVGVKLFAITITNNLILPTSLLLVVPFVSTCVSHSKPKVSGLNAVVNTAKLINYSLLFPILIGNVLLFIYFFAFNILSTLIAFILIVLYILVIAKFLNMESDKF